MVKVKICGITNLDDARLSVEYGADVLGFNFYEKSPRYIAPSEAREIIKQIDPGIETIGVFVNASIDEIANVTSITTIRTVQLHGDETPEFADRLRDVTGVGVIKALRVSAGFDPQAALEYNVNGFLLDTLSEKGYGGSGETFNWEIAREFKKIAPEFFLAGGLNPQNVADAVRAVRPSALDVCSGVESTKGKKDREKVAAFVRNARKGS
jgi:phosphoribosylanthranilate isomerase